MPRPTGKGARELDEKIAALVQRARRPGYDGTVRVSHIDPQPRLTPAKRPKLERERQPPFPGWTARPKECSREGCGEAFVPVSPAQLYCGQDCRTLVIRERETSRKRESRAFEKSKREGKRLVRVCALEGCEREFEPQHPRTIYCSSECRSKATKIIRARSRGRPVPKTRQVMELIGRLEAALEGATIETSEGTEYVVLLWTNVNRDPNTPAKVYEQLERMLFGESTTLQSDAA